MGSLTVICISTLGKVTPILMSQWPQSCWWSWQQVINSVAVKNSFWPQLGQLLGKYWSTQALQPMSIYFINCDIINPVPTFLQAKSVRIGCQLNEEGQPTRECHCYNRPQKNWKQKKEKKNGWNSNSWRPGLPLMWTSLKQLLKKDQNMITTWTVNSKK